MTTQFNIKQAICNVIAKMDRGEIASVPDALFDSFGTVEAYVEQAVKSQMAADTAKITKTIRNANQIVAVQLALPGMENASLPRVVWRTDENGEKTAIPWLRATVKEHKKEIRLQRQGWNVRDAVISTYEKTVLHMDELGTDNDLTIAEVMEQYSDE